MILLKRGYYYPLWGGPPQVSPLKFYMTIQIIWHICQPTCKVNAQPVKEILQHLICYVVISAG